MGLSLYIWKEEKFKINNVRSLNGKSEKNVKIKAAIKNKNEKSVKLVTGNQ